MAPALVLALAGMIAFSSSAFADSYDQDGRKTGSTDIDGTYAQISGNGFSPTPGNCDLYAVDTADFTAPRQIQAGLLRCDGMTLDPTTNACPGDHSYVERFNGTAYFCDSGYAITNNTVYDATTYRTSSTSTIFHGHVNGAVLDQASFAVSGDSIRGYAWGEATGGSTCPSPAKGTFANWQRFDSASGWSYVTQSTIHRESAGIAAAPCWSTISSTSSSGDFYVD